MYWWKPFEDKPYLYVDQSSQFIEGKHKEVESALNDDITPVTSQLSLWIVMTEDSLFSR